MIGDAWQWIPFMFVVLLVAIESQPQDQREAALVDGASRWQVFRYVTWPAILPVSVTVVLIRVIEAFKIIDLPNVLTNGGPGIASESMTLHAYVAWRALDLGGSAAVAYLLLFVVVFVCLSMLAFLRPAESGGEAMSAPRQPRGLAWLLRPRSPLDPSPLSMALVLRCPRLLGVRRAVSAVLGVHHLVQAADRRQRRAVLCDVAGLPALAACLEVHLRRPRPRHLPALSEHA